MDAAICVEPTRANPAALVEHTQASSPVVPVARRVALIQSLAFDRACALLPSRIVGDRYVLCRYALRAAGLLDGRALTMLAPAPCSRAALEEFHTAEYLTALEESAEAASRPNAAVAAVPVSTECGLCDDCEVFAGVHEYVSWVAGASLHAADALIHGQADVAVNVAGGWHHAKPGASSGFCWVNDIALAILRLQDTFPRVLYLDIDAHHGDGVQDAFYRCEDVMTVSFHHRAPGYFPGSGDATEVGEGRGRHRNLNVPLPRGAGDASFVRLFDLVLRETVSCFRPDAVVLQCGTDALAGDPLGKCNLTTRAYEHCVRQVLATACPTLLLGGGGYAPAAFARCWAVILAAACGRTLPATMPDLDDEESASYLAFRPEFSFHTSAAAMADMEHSDIETVESTIRLFFEAARKGPKRKAADNLLIVNPSASKRVSFQIPPGPTTCPASGGPSPPCDVFEFDTPLAPSADVCDVNPLDGLCTEIHADDSFAEDRPPTETVVDDVFVEDRPPPEIDGKINDEYQVDAPLSEAIEIDDGHQLVE